MIKTAYEYLFVVLSNKIAMVRKELDGFSVVPVLDSGEFFSSFEDPTQYWKDWVALTNFSIRHSEVDFAFLADKKDCRFAAADAKKPEQLKTAEQTVWTKQTVWVALKTVSEALGLPMSVSVREKGKQIFDLKVGDADKPLLLHLTRFGVVKDEKDGLEAAPIVKETSADQKSSSDKVDTATAGETDKKSTDAKQSHKSVAVKHPEIIGDSYNDPEALKLSVGDELKGTIVKIFNAMKRNYVKVEGLKEQVCFKSPDNAKFAVGDQVALTVTKVDEAAKKVLFVIALC